MEKPVFEMGIVSVPGGEELVSTPLEQNAIRLLDPNHPKPDAAESFPETSFARPPILKSSLESITNKSDILAFSL